MDSFEMAREWKGLSAAEQVDRWHKIMDEYGIEKAICFPTGSGNIAKNQELPFQIAVARASNTQFAKEYNARSDRLSCVGCLPMRSPKAAAEELRRAATELGLKGFEILPTGLPLALGDSFYDPIYEEAERLGVVLGIHGTRNTSRELGTSGLATFAEVHSYAFPVGHSSAVHQHGLPGIADPVSEIKARIPGNWRDLVTLLSRSFGRALGKTRRVRDAAAQEKTERDCARVEDVFQRRAGGIAACRHDRLCRRRSFSLRFRHSALGQRVPAQSSRFAKP